MDDDIADTGTGPVRQTLSQLRLRELLVEVQDRVEQIVDGRDRLDGLVEAMLVVTSGLELNATLRSIVHSATNLVDARYGALEFTAGITACCTSSMRASTRKPFGASATYPKAWV